MLAGRSRPVAGAVFYIIVCLVLAALLIAGRDSYLLFSDQQNAGPRYNEFALLCSEIPGCLRVGSGWSWKIIAETLKATTVFFYSYDVYGVSGLATEQLSANAERVAAVLHRMIALIPVFLAAVLMTRTWLAATLVICLAFAALLGWSPLLYMPLIDFYSLFADWPRYYWDFALPLQFYDFVSIGFLFLLLIRLSRPRHPGYAEAVLLVLCGQLLFENLGIVTGIAVALRCLLSPETPSRWRPALYRLAASAAASVALLTVMLALIQANKGADATSHATTLTDYFDSYRELVANNIRSLPIIIANIINLLTLPVVVGALGGWLLLGLEDPDRARHHQLAIAALSVTAGFAVTLFIGFFVNSYLAETGRQMLPFFTIVTIASCFTSRWLIARNRLSAAV